MWLKALCACLQYLPLHKGLWYFSTQCLTEEILILHLTHKKKKNQKTAFVGMPDLINSILQILLFQLLFISSTLPS